MQITHVITGLTIGGAQQLLLNLAKETLAHGHQVRVIGLRTGTMADEFRHAGIQVEELGMRGSASPATFFRLIARLRQQRPDIVHTHLGRADSYGRVAGKLAGVPVIVSTVHNVEQWKDRLTLRWIDACTAICADHLVACSDRVAKHLREVGLVSMSKVTVIRNGIRVEDWIHEVGNPAPATIRREFGCTADSFVIGTIGRLEEQKGHEYLFHALSHLKRDLPRIHLWVVGEGTLRERLERLAQELDLSANVRWSGNRRDLRAVYAALDLVVMPSLWEGLPIALLEAMACRRPVIATAVGGIPEVIQHEENGFLVPPRDSRALAAAIRRCHQNRGISSKLADVGCETIRSRFSIRDNACALLALYCALLSRSQTINRKGVCCT